MGQFIRANGLNIYYEEQGAGEPLILLHGGTANLESWSEQAPMFAPHFRVIMPDSRGHGRTENLSGVITYPLMADDMVAFIQALNLTRPHIFGYSDGGQIALDMGIRYPDVTGALVLGGTVYKFDERYLAGVHGMGFEAPGVVDLEKLDASHDGWIDYLKTAHPRPDDPDYWKTLLTQLSTPWLTPLGYTEDDLTKIRARTLILAGDREAGLDLRQALEMYDRIPDAALMVLPNADHGDKLDANTMQRIRDFSSGRYLTARSIEIVFAETTSYFKTRLVRAR